MAVDDKIRDEKYNMELTEKQQKYHHQVKTDKYEYLTGEKIIPTDQSRMIE